MINRVSEAEEQTAVMEWSQLIIGKYPDIRLLFHIPNGGSRHPAEAAHLKAQGVKAGVPDLFLPVPRGGYHGLFVEMKTRDGKISEAQRRWLHDLKDQGYAVAVCHGARAAIDTIQGYMEGSPPEVG